ncbi:hypothetical protein IHE44_0004180 [Lamprotornis superbus]|uniref:Uncharacterized protein n=1 Tax=Lamprotornis superbus TaxID=245042 RepID=A0A835TSV4_9PASS|nr:hypothetical protein IHE44_0004180 [Lamprotornis superbus]
MLKGERGKRSRNLIQPEPTGRWLHLRLTFSWAAPHGSSVSREDGSGQRHTAIEEKLVTSKGRHKS